MVRKPGFYWVLATKNIVENDWYVAQWKLESGVFRAHWELPGRPEWYDDDELVEIDERQIPLW